MDDNKVRIVIEVDSATGTAQIKGFGDKAAQAFDGIAKKAKPAAGAVDGAWKTLGGKSSATFKQMRLDAEKAYQAIANSGKSTADDLIRAERLKEQELARLYREQAGRAQTATQAMAAGFKQFGASILAGVTAVAIFNKIISTTTDLLKKGFNAQEEYGQSVAALGAMVVTFSEKQAGVSLETQWQGALRYSTAMIPILENIAARTLLSGRETTALANAFARAGVFLDANNAKQVEAFTRISNALPLMTQGQAIMMQLNSEIRAVMTGQNEQASMMLQTLKAVDPQIEAHLKTWRAQGTALENIGALLSGFGPATSLLENQWQAVKSTIDTTATQILRGLMQPAYAEIIEQTKTLNDLLLQNKDNILEWGKGVQERMKMIKDTMKAIEPFIKIFLGAPYKPEKAWDAGVIHPPPPAPAPGGDPNANETALAAVKKIQDAILKNSFELAAVGKSQYEQDLLAIQQEVAEYKKAGASKIEIAKYVSGATALARAKVSEEAKGLQKTWADAAGALSAKVEMVGLDDLRQAFFRNRLEAEKLKEKYAALPPALRAIAYAEIEAAQKADDAAVIEKARQKSAADWQKTLKEEAAATDKAAAAYDRLQASWDPFSGRAQEVAGAQQVIDDALRRGIITTEEAAAAVAKLGQRYVDLDAKSLKDFLKEINAIGSASFAGNTFGNTQADDIGKAIAALSEMNDLYGRQRDAVLALAEAREKAEKMAADTLEQRKNREKALAAITAREHSLRIDQIQGQFSAYRTMFGAVGNLYEENTKERQAMHQIEMALAAVEIAMNAQKAISAAVVAVTTQGAGDPYSAFARVAAMIALMAGVLSQIGVSFSGSGEAVAVPVLPPSTVLGAAPGTSSASVKNAYDLLEDTYRMEYRELSGIHTSMKDLNRNITGLVTNIVRNNGQFNAAGFAVQTGFQAGFAEATFQQYNRLTYLGLQDFFSKVTFGITGWADNLVGKLYGKVFGGGRESSVTASGIELDARQIGELLSGGRIAARQYADIKTEVEGGWFRSDKVEYSTRYKDLDAGVKLLLTNVFRDLGATMVEISRELGARTQATLDYEFAQVKINLQGMDAEAINKTISAFISDAGDQAVQALFGAMIGGYQQINEGLLETAARLIRDKAVIMDTLEMTNQAFAGTTLEAIAFSEAVIALAGDLDKLRAAAETYYKKFFTDIEKQMRLQAELSGALADLYLALPKTRDGFRQLVEGLDLGTEAGKQIYVTLLSLADAADDYYSAVEAAVAKQAELVDGLRSQAQTTEQWLSDMNRSTLAPVQSAEAWDSEYQRLKTLAAAPDHAAQDVSAFLNYAKEYLQFQKAYRGADYQDSFAQVTGDVQNIDDMVNTQLSVAEQQLAAAQALAAAAGKLAGAGQNLASAGLALQLAGLLGMSGAGELGAPGDLSAATLQVLFDKIGSAVFFDPADYAKTPPLMVVPTRPDQYAAFIAGATGTLADDLLKMPVDTLKLIYDKIEENTWAAWQAAKGPRYAGGGYHTGGWRLVGEEGPELEYTGPSLIFSNPQSKSMLNNLADLPAPRYDMPRSAGPASGIDADAVGRSISAQLRPMLAALAGGGANAKIELHVHLDGREIRASVTEGYRGGDAELINWTRKRVRG